MQLYTVWITRKGYGGDPPELVEAWDEYGIEENYAGWLGAYRAAVASIGDDLEDVRVIVLDVSQDAITEPFRPVDARASVTGVVDPPTEE